MVKLYGSEVFEKLIGIRLVEESFLLLSYLLILNININYSFNQSFEFTLLSSINL